MSTRLLISWTWFFLVLFSYYVLKPVREETVFAKLGEHTEGQAALDIRRGLLVATP